MLKMKGANVSKRFMLFQSMSLLFLQTWWNNIFNSSLTIFKPQKKRRGDFPEIGKTLLLGWTSASAAEKAKSQPTFWSLRRFKYVSIDAKQFVLLFLCLVEFYSYDKCMCCVCMYKWQTSMLQLLTFLCCIQLSGWCMCR